MSELATAYAQFKAGELTKAEKLLRGLINTNSSNVQAHHLLSIVLKAQTQFLPALNAIDKALKLAPDDVNIRYEKIQILKAKGDISEAVKLSESLLEKYPDHINAAILAGNYWLGQDYPEHALEIFNQALEHAPANPVLLRGQIFALKDTQAHEDAWEALGKIGDAPDLLYTKGQLYMEGFEPGKAITAFEEALNHPPIFMKAARDLLQCAYMSGGPEKVKAYMDKVETQFPEHYEFFLIAAEVCNEIGLGDEALDWIEKFEHKSGPHAQSETSRSMVYIKVGEEEKAFEAAQRGLALSPDHEGAAMGLAQSALMARRPELALKTARQYFKAHPDKQSFWTAMEATALRVMGKDKAYHKLMDYDKMIGVYDLDAPEGYESLESFLDALKTQLLSLHEWQEHPLFQSLRQGTQTSQDLRHLKHPVLQSFFKAIEKPIEHYIAAMPPQADHPFFGRKAETFRLSGAWSVALRPGGFHLNHIHPKGWISSSFYVDVPKGIEDSVEKSGWIQFGAPPFEVADSGPEHFICPKPGRLVLFPSYMWHGTIPFQQGERRLTLPFDIMPLTSL